MNRVRSLRVDRRGPCATVTLDRQDVHNAFDEDLIRDLTTTFERLSTDTGVRAIVLTGAGPSFCAGADLNWMRRVAAYTHEENVADAMAFHRMMSAIAECPKVTVARVHGTALGGGAGMVAACDVAIASHDARFGFTEVRLGLAPAVIAPYVVRKIGAGAFRALAVTGDRFGPEEALRVALVQRVVPAQQLDEAVAFVVSAALACGPGAVAATKRLLSDIEGISCDEAAQHTAGCIAGLRASAEGQEGIHAFLGKRKPSFSV